MKRYYSIKALSLSRDGDQIYTHLGNCQTLNQAKRLMLDHQDTDIFHVWLYTLRGHIYGEPSYRGRRSTWETDHGKVRKVG